MAATGLMRVLIVDDEPDIRLLLRTLLSLDQRFEVAGEADDGNTGLERYRELRPDVVILDQRMPGMVGIEVAAKILADERSQTVILLSAYVDDALAQEAKAIGVRGVIGKQNILDLGPEILRLVSNG